MKLHPLLTLALLTTTAFAEVERIWMTHQSADNSKIVISWETTNPGDSAVEFGASPEHVKTPLDLVSGRVHEIPADQIVKTGALTIFRDIPIYDAPVLIAGKGLLHENSNAGNPDIMKASSTAVVPS